MRLLVTCPHCDTSYEIDDQQVNDTGGQVRCYNCSEVFNALLNSQPVMDGDSSMMRSSTPLDSSMIESNSLPSQSLDLGSNLDSRDRELFSTTDDQPEVSGPDDASLGSSRTLRAEEILDIKTEDLPSLDPIKASAGSAAPSYSTSATIGWSLAILALLITALGQLGWYNRQDLVNDTSSRSLIESACGALPIRCKLPPRRAPRSYEIVDRKISVHSEVEGVLNLSILFINRADFAQPAPGIELSLFDENHRLIARRSFLPRDYLDDRPATPPLYEPEHVQKISLNMEDPGSDVTGFEFDFF
jgi:predicted Zn finger-like uncharacterized protein